MSKFFLGLTKDQIIDRLTAQDVRTILLAAEEQDYKFLTDVLQGNGVVPYRKMTDDDLMGEWHDRKSRVEELIEDNQLPWQVE